jgi:hypothetical protein
MTDIQFYIAIAIPTLAVLAGIMMNVVHLNGVNSRLNSMDNRIDARFNSLDVKFDTLTGKVVDLDNRVTRIEAKLGIG